MHAAAPLSRAIVTQIATFFEQTLTICCAEGSCWGAMMPERGPCSIYHRGYRTYGHCDSECFDLSCVGLFRHRPFLSGTAGRGHDAVLHVGISNLPERHSCSPPEIDLRPELHTGHADSVRILWSLFSFLRSLGQDHR